jgi:CheY-like chemotaxis protein
LNNVLAPITMGIELLRLRPGEKESRHVLSTLESSARRGAEIIRQILTFARGVETKRMLVQPRHLIKDMVRMAQETFPRNISIRTDLANDCWPIDGDPTQIHQVLLNLSVNARDVLTNGGQIKFSCRNVTLEHPMLSFGLSIPAGQYVVLGVEDNGPGISQEVFEHLFEPFFTTKEPGKGTGLGLSTTFGIAKGHNGLIEVITQPGHGTRFDVYFPATTAETKPSEFSGQDMSPTPRGRGETILVVDDEADIRTVTKALLETYGYKVLLAEDGVEGVAIYAQKKEEIALVLTDIMMPFMDGVALVRSLRKLNPAVRVIGASGLLSENAAVSRRQTLIELGVTIILKKPFAAEELLGAIKAALA